MELIAVLIFAVLGILGAAISRQVTDEFKAWAPWFIRRIIERAVRNSPEHKRERLAEEWPSYVDEIPGDIGKLIVAFGFLSASWKLSLVPYKATKRVLDVAFSAIGILLLGPLLALTGVAIRLDLPGPILIRQRRLGRNGKEFTIVKFRTLSTVGGPIAYRVTRVGKFLRRTSLDELPLLFNVLSGEMSLVGPPPARPSDLETPPVLLHHNVKPGLVGRASLNGAGVEANSASDRNLDQYDFYYINNRSLFIELRLLLTSLRIFLFGGSRK